MELESARLQLKEISMDDLEIIHALYSLPEVDEYNTLGIPENIDKTRETILPMIAAQTATNRTSYS